MSSPTASDPLATLVRTAVAGHIEQEQPDRLDELEPLIPSLYRALLDESPPGDEATAVDHNASGRPFDLVAFSGGFSLASVVWATYWMARTALDLRSQGQDPAKELARMEPELGQQTGDPAMVRAIRQRLLSMVLDLDDLERATFGSQQGTPSRNVRPPGRPGSGPPLNLPDWDAAALGELEPLPAPEERSEGEGHGIDLRLLVVEEERGGDRFLRFLNGGGEAGLSFGDLESPRLRRPLGEVITSRFDQMRDLPTSTSGAPMLDRRLRNLGQTLAEELLPAPLAEILLRHRKRVRSLQILSDEPWVPWEVLALTTEDGRQLFLSELFELTRWRREANDRTELPVNRLALIAPRDSGLPSTADETEEILSLAGPERAYRLPAAQRAILEALDANRFDAWHFATHARAEEGDPSRWRLLLEGQTDLGIADFTADLSPQRPLVFLNACSAGRGDLSLTGIAGFADKLLRRGAGAVIGPLWEVSDHAAAAFAVGFYRSFFQGASLARSLAHARRAARTSFPQDPTWLAYTAFGHPRAHCRPAPERQQPGDAGQTQPT